MLGRHHFSITLFTVLPFFVPLIFLENKIYFIYSLAFLFAALVGSLTPDADCGGKASVYYRFRPVDWLMKNIIIKISLLLFNNSSIKGKLKITEEVKNEHRGIMHSPVGIILSSFFLTLVVLIFMLFAGVNNLSVYFLVFLGLIVGQMLHILEDSCTASGINWKFPFGVKELKGKIYTFQKEEGKIDIRPDIYQAALVTFTLALFFFYAIAKINYSLFFVYPFILLFVSFLWIIFFKLSNNGEGFWYKNKRTVKNVRKHFRRFSRSQFTN